MANEDKILSENYFQHADHFTRVLNEQENRIARVSTGITTQHLLKQIKQKILKK